MPLLRGSDKETTRKNFEEFGRGKTYARTKKRKGKKRADKQRIAVVLSNQRKSKSRSGGR
jgi:hypothetical protein